MRLSSIRCISLAVLMLATTPVVMRADFIVAPGWDLWVTDPGATKLGGAAFEGVPLGEFNFEDSVGVQDVGNTDTIIRRLEPAVVGGPGETATMPIEMVALQLRSVEPIDLFPGNQPPEGPDQCPPGVYYATLQTDNPSRGSLNVTFDNMDGGTYDSQLNVNFDLRFGALDGSVCLAETLDLSLDPPGPWRRIAPTGSVKIKGVNHQLKPDMSIDQDFWPGHPPKDPRVYNAPPPCQPHGETGMFDATHCITTTMKPPKAIKWSQPPEFGLGENIPSDFDWRDVMHKLSEQTVANAVIADDFRSDGRPIQGVRWWGSYPDHLLQPQRRADGSFRAVTEDAFVISFFRDVPDPDGPGPGFSRPGELVGTYVAPISHVKLQPTEIIGWDWKEVWEYKVHLEGLHADHLVPGLSEADQFLEKEGEIYWISIAAENGHFFDKENWKFFDNGDPQFPDPSKDPQFLQHFWGWHTSPAAFNDSAVFGNLLMPAEDWVYGYWSPVNAQHFDNNMAFELLTPEPSTSVLLVVGLMVTILRKRR